MNESKKKKKKRKDKYPYYGSVFAPIYPNRMGTPKTSGTGASGTGEFGGPGSVGGTSGGGVSIGGVSAVGGNESVIPPSRRKVIHEMRMVFGNITEYDNFSGTSAPNGIMTGVTPGSPQITGPGFANFDDQGNKYNFKKSPGLGFRSVEGWKLWQAAMDIVPRGQTMTVSAIIQAAMERTGIRFGKVDAGEIKLLEMGLQWYLSDTGRLKDGSAGVNGVPLNGQGGSVV